MNSINVEGGFSFCGGWNFSKLVSVDSTFIREMRVSNFTSFRFNCLYLTVFLLVETKFSNVLNQGYVVFLVWKFSLDIASSVLIHLRTQRRTHYCRLTNWEFVFPRVWRPSFQLQCIPFLCTVFLVCFVGSISCFIRPLCSFFYTGSPVTELGILRHLMIEIFRPGQLHYIPVS